ncbi:hypothetical protein [Allomesorhizobium camelthorni]|uniref:Uncharacterized protein n=1 Tax=Allomesorhizobium camelthorni TaxID=475069 RepID=A0A6G4WH21_9HYPH|nr:hypothetical protein [Mesorhizobium camelthorni]NGO53493.1 hypothetical protein [Mesorhizobium camelthorni]
MLLDVKFEGNLADLHKLPAYDGTQSLVGITRTILIVANYIVEGKVRRREFGNVPLTFNLIAQKPGSFESLYEVDWQAAAIVGALGAGVAGNLLTDLLKAIYSRATGVAVADEPENIRALEATRGGDVAALVDAVEPSIRLGHNVINHGAITININNVTERMQIANLNPGTKRYVWESVINNEIRTKLFSIGSFNANNGTGRAFDLEEGRSIAFELEKDVDRESVNALLVSINS